MPTIYKDYLNIEPIESGNPFTIVIIDSSSYFRYPEGAALDVTIPGYNDFFEVPFKPSLVNVYNSSTLGLNQLLCVDGLTALPDGIWKYRYKVCPYDQTFTYRSFYKTSLLDERIKQIYNEIDLKACGSNDIDYLKNQVVRIHILREGARAVVEINERKACENYQAALDLAEQIIERNCHNCKIR